MMARVISADHPDVSLLVAEEFAAGRPVILPTETVYGLAAPATDPLPCQRIFAVKGRPQDNPLIVHVASVEMAKHYARDWPEEASVLAKQFWPGPLTIIVWDAGLVAPEVTAGTGKIGVRMPRHPVFMNCIAHVGIPFAAPSANVSGRPSGTDVHALLEDFGGHQVLIVDGGMSEVGVESTIVDLTGSVPLVVREGVVSLEMLQQVLPHMEHRTRWQEGMTVSPGLKYRHYAPKATLVVGDVAMQIASIPQTTDRVVLLTDRGTAAMYPDVTSVVLGDAHTPMEALRELYRGLRACDLLGADWIVATPWDSTLPGGSVLMQRLLKAAGAEKS